MKIGYVEWHDGIGYDLDALAALPAKERRAAEDLVIARHLADWRDVVALDHIGSKRTLRQLKKAASANSLRVRMEATERLATRRLLSEGEIEEIIVDALARTTLLDGMAKTLDVAAAHPTAAVRRQLLSCALRGNDDIRVHAAALVHFLYGGASSAFDMAFQSFYVRFDSKSMRERRSAYVELCAKIGVEPED